MICWDRSGEVIIGTFLRPQLDWLGRHFTSLRAALTDRARGYTTDYPLGDVLGVALPRTHTDDQVLLALIDYYMTGEPGEIRLLWEPELFDQLGEALDTATRLIPTSSGTVLLHNQATLTGWLWAVEALGVATAGALGRPELMRGSGGAGGVPHDPSCLLVAWLRGVFESLTDIAYPAPAG